MRKVIVHDLFYYNNYLDSVLGLYDIPNTKKPSIETYLKYVYQDKYDKLVVTKLLFDAEKAELEALSPEARRKFKARQTAIVKESIHAYLELIKNSVDLAAITAEFQRTQKDKHYLIYKKGKFLYERFHPDELVVRSVLEIKGETLVLETAHPGSAIHMMLRWKNHQGVLFPAWQVKLVRATR